MQTTDLLKHTGSRPDSAPPPHGAPKATTGPNPQRIMQLAWGYAPTLVLECAVRHGIFDALDASPLTAPALAQARQLSPRGVTAILNALTGLELLEKRGHQYALTPESATFLVSSKPTFQGGIFNHISRQLLPQWLKLDEVVRTGKPNRDVHEEADGAAFFAEFVEAIFPMSYAAAKTLGEYLELANTSQPYSVLDVAAGSGVWGIALAQMSPKVSVLAVDWPKVLEVTQRVATKHGVASQIRTSPGDLMEADFGRNHHLATLGHILHSEGPARSRQLLRRCFEALRPGGIVAIAEFVPNDDRTGPPQPLLFAVNMLVNTDEGDTFTFSEISSWLREAGFINPRQLEAPGPSPLILATRPEP